MVTEQELRELLQAHGWSLAMVSRYQTRFAYAKRRVAKKGQSRYLGTERKLDQLTPEEVLRRINK